MFSYVLSHRNRSCIFELRGLGTYLCELTNSGRLQLFSSDNSNDLAWCTWTDAGYLITDYDINYFNIHVLDGNNIVLFYTTNDGMTKVAIWPGDFPLYGNSDPYRFYYGIDSETLYMNVENRWVPVSYLSHDKMHDIGTMTHEQLESTIVGALQRISSLEDVQPEVSFTKEEW